MQILSTKLFIPPLRSRLVIRERLIQKLNQGMECGFILVSAPAGYGKTTLLSAWIYQLKCDHAWLTLDEGDNDLSRFLAYLAAALQKIEPSIGEVLKNTLDIGKQPDIEKLLNPLINQLSQIEQPFCLVLDEYHTIQNQNVHDLIGYLLEHHPGRFHLVIGTRADPPLPLAKLRAHSDMTEVRLADLRFTVEEATVFLRSCMGLQIKPEDVASITRRTEGWIAGLQMAALSMQNIVDISSFVAAFTGSHHYIFEYLIEEILKSQPPEIYRFLLYTSVLEQLTAPICDALLAGDIHPPPTRPSALILDELEHANLFIIPLDHEQLCYRYHPLFAELMRGFLQQINPSLIPLLHTRASSWYEEQGFIPDAIRHSIAASDWERVVSLVSANIFALLEQNELNSVARQFDNMPDENTSARPWLLIGRAWLAAYTGQLSAVEPILKKVEVEFTNLKSEVELQILGGHIAAIRAYAFWIGNNRELAASAAQVALDWLPEAERLIRCQAATLLGLTLSDTNARALALRQALAYARECGVSHVTIFAHGCWAWLLVMQGRLREAHAACLETIELAQSCSLPQALPTLSHVYSTLSFVLCEWYDLEGALYYSKEAVSLARRWEQADALHFALDNLGHALFESGDVAGAFAVMQQTWQVAQRTSTWFEEITISQEIGWYLAQGSVEAAVQRLHQAQIDIDILTEIQPNSFISQLMPLAILQVFIAQKQYSKAQTLAEQLLEYMEKKRIGYYLIRVLLWQSLAYQGLGQDTQALDSLRRALVLAAPEGYVRTFISAVPGLALLLQQARLAGIQPDYVDKLMVCAKRVNNLQLEVVSSNRRLIEPLTDREMEVLKLLGQGFTDKKIADKLVIARETVHKHLKNIYGKLDVHSRTEAVIRSRELNLL